MLPLVVMNELSGPGFLGQAIGAKYLEGRLLYRVQRQLERYGGTVSRATLCDLVSRPLSRRERLRR